MPLSKPIVGVSGKVYNELVIPGGAVVMVSSFGHNLWVIPRSNRSPHSLDWCAPPGTRGYGVLILMIGVPNDGSKQPTILIHRLGCMETCMLRSL